MPALPTWAQSRFAVGDGGLRPYSWMPCPHYGHNAYLGFPASRPTDGHEAQGAVLIFEPQAREMNYRSFVNK